jgi:glucokinase
MGAMRDRDFSDDDIFLGLDVGGTFLKGARIDGRGQILERLHEPIRKDTTADLMGQFEEAVRTLEARGPARAVGVGLPGIVERKTGAVHNAPNVKVLDGLNVGAQMKERTGRPTFAENDANAAALAESWLGAGRSAEDVLFVTLGTGVGGGLVFDGRIWQGRSGYAGEIGHVQAVPDGIPCGCGSRGCVETVAGIGGWIRRAEAARAVRETALRGRDLDPAVIVEAARQGDAVALDIVDETARALAIGIAAALNLMNVDRVVIGGGVAQAGPFLLDRIAGETRKRTFAHVFEDADFRAAELGADAGVVGAARVAMVGLHR